MDSEIGSKHESWQFLCSKYNCVSYFNLKPHKNISQNMEGNAH